MVSRVTNDTESVKALYVQVLFVMLDSSIVVIGVMAAMAWLDWRLMLLAALLLPAMLAIVWLYQRWSAPSVTRARALRSDINAQMAESIAGMSVLQASNAAGRFAQRFDRANHNYYRARMAELTANAWLLRPALDLLKVLLLAAVIYSFSQRPLGALQIGVLYAFISYIGRMVDPLIQITMQFSQLQQAVVAAARVDALLQEPAAAADGGQGRIGQGAVSFRRLNFAYQPEHPVLRDLSLEIPAGGFIGIVGHTGSGKSTLLSLLLRFYAPQGGDILIDEQPLASFDDAAFRDGVGLVPQEPFLLAASARDNIAMGRPLSQQQIEDAARRRRPRTDPGAGAGLRHRYGRERIAAVQRPEAVDRHRPRTGRQAAHPAAGRGHLAYRQRNRTAGAARAGTIAWPDHADLHRPSPVHHPRRRPHHRAESRPDRRNRRPRGADDAGRHLPTAILAAAIAAGSRLSEPIRHAPFPRPARARGADRHPLPLDAPELAPMLSAVLQRARAAGVGQILVPAVRADTFDAAAAMRREHGCWIGFGLHPIYLEQHLDEHLEQLERALREQRPEAVGKSAWISTCRSWTRRGRRPCSSNN